MNISDLPEYAQAAAKHTADVRQAEQTGDQDALARAGVEWERAMLGFDRRVLELERVDAGRASVLAEIKRDHPDVPESVYAHLTDPDAIRAAAKSVHEAIVAKVQESGGSWGGSPAGGTGGAAGGGQQQLPSFDEAQKALVPGVLEGVGNMAANNQFRANEFAAKIGVRFGNRDDAAK